MTTTKTMKARYVIEDCDGNTVAILGDSSEAKEYAERGGYCVLPVTEERELVVPSTVPKESTFRRIGASGFEARVIQQGMLPGHCNLLLFFASNKDAVAWLNQPSQSAGGLKGPLAAIVARGWASLSFPPPFAPSHFAVEVKGVGVA